MVGMGWENDSDYEEDKENSNELEYSEGHNGMGDSDKPCNICKENSGIQHRNKDICKESIFFREKDVKIN
jgi:hypothetical protein